MKSLSLLILICALVCSTTPLALATDNSGNAIPTIGSGSGKSVNLVISPEDGGTGRVKIWISEWQRNGHDFVSALQAAGFQVGAADTTEFLVPASACTFQEQKYVNCDTSKLTDVEQQAVELALFYSGGTADPIIRFRGADLNKDSLSFRVSTSVIQVSSLGQNGTITTSQSLGFKSTVWIYVNQQLNGWFGHSIAGLRY